MTIIDRLRSFLSDGLNAARTRHAARKENKRKFTEACDRAGDREYYYYYDTYYQKMAKSRK